MCNKLQVRKNMNKIRSLTKSFFFKGPEMKNIIIKIRKKTEEIKGKLDDKNEQDQQTGRQSHRNHLT